MYRLVILLVTAVVARTENMECIVIPSSGDAFCSNISLPNIPARLPPYVRNLDISYNQIPVLVSHGFIDANLLGLESVDASFCGINNIEEGAFKGMNKLQTLNISDNKIEQIKPLAFHDTTIQILYLERNCLGVLEPRAFQGLDNSLEKLYLSGNQITTIHPGAFEGLKYLTELHLQSNMIMAFRSATFSGLPKLTYLSASNNTLHIIDPDAFMGASMIEEVYLDHNIIGSIRIKALNGLSNMKTLDLSFNKLKSLSSTMFEGLTSLSRLVLHNNNIQNISKRSFSTLRDNLVFLDISHNPIGHVNPETFYLPQLAYLDLSGCRVKNISSSTFNKFASFSAEKSLTLILNECIVDCDCGLQSLWETCKSTQSYVDCIGEPVCDSPDIISGQDWRVFHTQNCAILAMSSSSSESTKYSFIVALAFSVLLAVEML